MSAILSGVEGCQFLRVALHLRWISAASFLVIPGIYIAEATSDSSWTQLRPKQRWLRKHSSSQLIWIIAIPVITSQRQRRRQTGLMCMQPNYPHVENTEVVVSLNPPRLGLLHAELRTLWTLWVGVSNSRHHPTGSPDESSSDRPLSPSKAAGYAKWWPKPRGPW